MQKRRAAEYAKAALVRWNARCGNEPPWMVQAAVVARTGSVDEARAKRFFESLQIHP